MKNTFFLFLLLATFSCSNTSGTNNSAANEVGYVNVSPEEFKKLMTASNTVILDVRTPRETSRGMIEGAVPVDFKNNDFSEKLDGLDKNKTYLVYCHAGGRSSETCKMMKEKGFKQLYNLDSGYAGWE